MNKIKKISKLKEFIFCVLLIFGVAMCSALVTSFATSPQNASIDGIDYTFLVDPNENTATITKVDPHDKIECNIPSVLMGYPVKSIGTQTENMQDVFQIAISEDSYIPFSQCSNLESVTIPESVESIGSLTFMDCPNLTSVIIPNTVTSIYFYAFYNCSSIQSLTIPHSVTSIGAKAFVCDENNHLSTLFIPENAQVQPLSDQESGDSITTIVPNSTIVYKYNVLDQTNVSEGKIPVEIVSARAECNHNESPEDDIDIPDTIDCGAMGEKYAINSISFTEVQLIHNLTHFNAIDPTCSSPGNREYWYCDQCEKYFDDAQGDTETEADSLIIGATGHNLAHHAATPATCTFPGNCEYWYCDQCEKYFNDENGENEITTDSCIIPAAGHTLTAHEAKEPTCSEDGNSAYWSCSKCEKYFRDENGENEITTDSWIIPAAGHTWDANWSTDGSEHWHECSVCNEKKDEEAHNYDAVTTYVWKNNNKCTATRTCEICSYTEEEETSNITSTTTAATCTEAGSTVYTATFTNTAFNEGQDRVKTVDIPSTGHNMAAHAAVAATCTEAGNSAYWSCSKCGKYFGDENGETEIAENSWIIEATGHNLAHFDAVDPTCTSPGNREYWYCDQCEKYFGNTDATQEIEENSWIIEAAHDLQHEDKVEPTEDDDGHIAGWTCNICHKHFSDENGTQEITNWIIPHGSYQLGDVDEDGALTMQDLEALHTVLIGEKVMIKIRDDIDGDGIVTWQDLEALFQILLIQ